MIIASIFAFFYFCLCPDARNHRQSIADSPPFFMFPCFAVFLICAGFSLPEFQPNFVPHNEKQHILYLMVFVGNVCSQFTVHMKGAVYSVAWLWSSLPSCLTTTASIFF